MRKIERMLILDFGSQYTQLIARRIREMGVFAEIASPSTDFERLIEVGTKGIILSGGPGSVSEESFDRLPAEMPILGICYGMQLLNLLNGGTVKVLEKGEYGRQKIVPDSRHPIFAGLDAEETVWMSHRESVARLAPGFKSIATSKDDLVAAIGHDSLPYFGLQFHPEVTHTDKGEHILRNFLRFCGCSFSWTIEDYIEKVENDIRVKVGDGKIVSLVSGGVDSTAATFLCLRAVGSERVFSIHIDSGLMRLGESDEVVSLLKKHGLPNVCRLNCAEEFMRALRGVIDPEEKRKIIGDLFVEIIDREIAKFSDSRTFLCQGTLYTDLIESGMGCGKSADVIKSHHNVSPKIIREKRRQGMIIEPNNMIFKDEARKVCLSLGIPNVLVERHPFPGPGLAIRILGEVTGERVKQLRLADRIFIEEILNAGLYNKIWQAFAVLLPVKAVGVMGDKRTYGSVIALRAVVSQDGMTADFAKMPYDVLGRVSARIVNEVEGINRVVYDVTSKPPGTIEWE